MLPSSTYFLSSIVLFRLKSLRLLCSSVPWARMAAFFSEAGPVGDSRVRPDNRRLDDAGPAPGKSGLPSGPQQPRRRARRQRPAPGWEGGEAAAQDTIILSVEDLDLARETIALAQQEAAAARDEAAAAARDQEPAAAGDGEPAAAGDGEPAAARDQEPAAARDEEAAAARDQEAPSAGSGSPAAGEKDSASSAPASSAAGDQGGPSSGPGRPAPAPPAPAPPAAGEDDAPAAEPAAAPHAPSGAEPASAGAALAARPRPSPSPATRRAMAPAAEPRPVPSWGTVLVTTVRLWAQRRLHRPSGARPATVRPATARPVTPRPVTAAAAGARPASGPGPAAGARPAGGAKRGIRWRLTLVLVVAAALFAAGAVTVALTLGPGTSTAKGNRGQAGSGQLASAAAIRAAATARAQAAAWIMAQVATDAIVACDPLMCADLQHAGLPAGRLLVLGTGSTGPLGSDVIVATAAVRQEFGARLTSVYAPVTLASFGSGSAQASIRVVAPDGSAAYLSGLHADEAARAAAGSQLLENPRIHESAAVHQALKTGQVDSRLLTVLAALSTMHTMNVLAVGTTAAGASTGMPLRWADITPGAPMRRHPHRLNTIRSLAGFLQDQQAPFQPAITAIRLDGRAALHIQFAAPSPLGLLGKS